jgi:hypothetical protein
MSWTRRTVYVCSLALATTACKRGEPKHEASERTEQAAPAPAEPAPKAWFEGRWQADLELTSAAPTSGAGLPREWKEEPQDLLGPARLEVTFGADKQASGSLRFGSAATHAGKPTRPLTVLGALQGDTLRATLEPSTSEGATASPPGGSASATPGPVPDTVPDADALRGTLVVAPPETSPCGPGAEPSVLEGTLRLSSGDGLLVRRAKVSLERAETNAPPHAPR